MNIVKAKVFKNIPERKVRNKYPDPLKIKVGGGFILKPHQIPKGYIGGMWKRFGIRLASEKQNDGSLKFVRIA